MPDLIDCDYLESLSTGAQYVSTTVEEYPLGGFLVSGLTMSFAVQGTFATETTPRFAADLVADQADVVPMWLPDSGRIILVSRAKYDSLKETAEILADAPLMAAIRGGRGQGRAMSLEAMKRTLGM